MAPLQKGAPWHTPDLPSALRYYNMNAFFRCQANTSPCFHLPCNLKANRSLHKWCRLRYFVVIAISGGLRSPCIDVSLQPVPLIQSHLPGPLSIFSLGQVPFLAPQNFSRGNTMQKVLNWKTKLKKFVGSTGRTCQVPLTSTSCRGQRSFCPSLSSSLIFFFILCAHPSLRGIKFFYPNNTRFGQTVINENGVSHVWLWTPSQGPEDSASVVWSKISWSWVGHFSFK